MDTGISKLFHVRRWLFFALIATGILLPLMASIALYWGFWHVHHPDYPSIFAVLTVSCGISVVAIAVPSAWILMQPALEDSARVRLMLNLYSLAMFVFVCDLMAGSRSVLHNTEVHLLDAPYRLQFSLSAAIIIVIVLVVLSIPMFHGSLRQAEEVEELGKFEENTLRALTRGFRSLSVTDKVSFVDNKLRDLRDREESFGEQLSPTGYLFRKVYDLLADEGPDTVADEEDVDANKDPDALVEEDLKRIGAHGLLWTTSSSWGERVTEIRNLGDHMEMFWKKTYAERLAELTRSRPTIRFVLKIKAYGETIVLKHLTSWIRDLAKYLGQVESKDFRWRHLFWLQDLIASMTIMRNEIDRLQGHKIDRLQGHKRKLKYIEQCAEQLDREYELAVRDARNAREEKRFGGRVVMPFAIPLTMVVATPFIQHIIHGFRL